MAGHVQLSVFGADHAPATLAGSCGSNPGLACGLVWDLSHDGRAATLTSEFLAGPVHLLLRVCFVVLLAFIIQAIVHRLINRLTGRAEHSLLPQLRGTVASSRFVPSRGDRAAHRPARAARRPARRRRGWRGWRGRPGRPGRPGGRGPGRRGPGRPGPGRPGPGGPELATAPEAAGAFVSGLGGVTAAGSAADRASQGHVNGAAAQAEVALVDERRKQRVRALAAILRSASSVTIFAIAGFAVLGDLGINLAPLLASAGVVGVAVGFGAQNLVRDYLSGIFMLVEDQYGVGDVITVGDATGTVENVTLRITRVRDVNGIVWHVRNGAIETVGNESQGWARGGDRLPRPLRGGPGDDQEPAPAGGEHDVERAGLARGHA